ncbi:hypothetical protein ACFYOK_04825 [Microbispora bryophytorum]
MREDDPMPPGIIAVIGLLGRQGPMTTSDLAAARGCARSRWRAPSAS